MRRKQALQTQPFNGLSRETSLRCSNHKPPFAEPAATNSHRTETEDTEISLRHEFTTVITSKIVQWIV
jgi:hypothetical protein